MNDQKKWVKMGEGKYSFIVNDKEEGRLTFQPQTVESKATITLSGKNYLLQRKGFWKSQLELTGDNGQPILKTYYEKWYANSSVLEYSSRKFKLVVRNNPMAEWAILADDKEWLAYGLTTDNGKVAVKITTAAENNDWLFDFLLWYLFAPVAHENSGDSVTFFMLTATQ